VTWRTVLIDGEQEEETFAGTYSDGIGRFRTMDIAGVVANYGFELDPTRVELTVSKPGYTMTRRFRRTRASQIMGLVEVDFEVTRDAPAAEPAPP
jgi:hypothetical protein